MDPLRKRSQLGPPKHDAFFVHAVMGVALKLVEKARRKKIDHMAGFTWFYFGRRGRREASLIAVWSRCARPVLREFPDFEVQSFFESTVWFHLLPANIKSALPSSQHKIVPDAIPTKVGGCMGE